MQMTSCKHCGKKLSSAGMRGHLRFMHGIEEPTINDFQVLDEIYTKKIKNSQVLENTAQIPQNYSPNPQFTKELPAPQTQFFSQNPINWRDQVIDPLDLMEKQLNQQMRIKNLQIMMQTLNTPTTQSKDTLSEVVTMMDLMDKIQARAVERASVSTDGEVSLDPADQMVLGLLQSYINRPQQMQTPTTNTPIQQNSQGGNEMFGEDFLRRQIKAGKISKEQIMQWLKNNGKEMPEELVDAYIEDCKNDAKI